MKRVGIRIATLLAGIFLCATGSALAADVTLGAANHFKTLAAGDGDGDNNKWTVTGNLTMNSGSNITCNDNAADQPPGPVANNASACNITIVVTGDMVMQAGSAIRAENNNSGGNGGAISITVGGTLTLRGAPSNGGAVISSNKTSGAGDTGVAGNITITAGTGVIGGIVTEPGSSILANGPGQAGNIVLNGAKSIDIDGLVESKGSTTIGHGGRIDVIAGCTITVSDTGKISSRGQDPGADRVHLEAGCDVQIFGLVESTGPGHVVPPANSCHNPSRPDKPANSAACVEVWSGGTLTIDSTGSHNGEINADVAQSGGSSGRGWIDLYAAGAVNLVGDTTGAFIAHANAGLGGSTGGIVTVKSVTATVTASGRALQASATAAGSNGGVILIEANLAVKLDTATLEAKGNASGGAIEVRSSTSSLSWQGGVGDVRPNASGTIKLFAGTTINTTGTNFNGEVPTTGIALVGPPTLPAYVVLPACLCGGGPGPDCPTCDGTTVTVDQNVTVNFNVDPAVCSGDADLCAFFTADKSGGATPDKWLAVFDVGGKAILIKSGATITTATVNGSAPGIKIVSTCTLEIEFGGSILVASVNKNAGPIVIEIKGNITINGKIKDSVSGTNGLPGDIVISGCCSSITTGPDSLIETEGVDPGGSDINISTCCGVGGNITLNGFVFAHAHAHVPATPRPDIRVASFNGSVTINSSNVPFFDEITIAGGKYDLFRGLLSLVESGSDPGSVVVQAEKDVTVHGHGNDPTAPVRTSFAAVAAGTLTSNSSGGTVDVRSHSGTITGTDRAFQSAGRIHNAGEGLINLLAAGDISLSRVGATADFNPVVDSSGNISGGVNTIRSFTGTITVGVGALVSAVGAGGSNALTSCGGVTNSGTVNPADANPADDIGVCAPAAPDLLYTDCSQLGRDIPCNCTVAAVRLDVPGTFALLNVPVRDWAGAEALVCEDPKVSRVLFG